MTEIRNLTELTTLDNNYFVPIIPKCFADKSLRFALRVHIGGVKVVYPSFIGALQNMDCLSPCRVSNSKNAANSRASKTYFRDNYSGVSQLPVIHARFIPFSSSASLSDARMDRAIAVNVGFFSGPVGKTLASAMITFGAS